MHIIDVNYVVGLGHLSLYLDMLTLFALFLQVHHTATHLLQAALKKVIGQETSQAGSLVAFDRLRFDFNFHRPLLDNEVMQIESLINRWIGDAALLQTKVMPIAEAKRAGAIAMFGEKYGDQVKILILSALSDNKIHET